MFFLTHSVCSTGFYWTVNQRACSGKLHRSISVYASKQASKACRRLSEYIIARICTSNSHAPPPPCTSASSLVAAGGARTRGRHDSTGQQRTPPTCIRRHTMPTEASSLQLVVYGVGKHTSHAGIGLVSRGLGSQTLDHGQYFAFTLFKLHGIR